MKIGIIGTGFVGASSAYALIMNGVGREIVLIDLDKKRAVAEAEDLFHAVPFAHPLTVRAGDYPDLADSKVVIIAAGVSQKPGETRIQLLERNAHVFRLIIPQVLRHAPDAILLIATNPVDVMTHLAAQFASELGIPSGRIIGSGTTLDTARFRVLLSQQVGVDANHVHAYVLGEHGDSEVLAWSAVRIGGQSLDDFSQHHQVDFSKTTRERIDRDVRNAAYKIIDGKGATYYGIGAAIARISRAIVNSEQAILTVCTHLDNLLGVENVTVALPHLVGSNGILKTFTPTLTAEENQLLKASASKIKALIVQLSEPT